MAGIPYNAYSFLLFPKYILLNYVGFGVDTVDI